MLQPLHVHFLPDLMHSADLKGGTAVIIDILRASSTIITALHNGARQVIPCSSPEQALEIRAQAATDAVLLGGERGGVLIDGFDCGNSPMEYPPSRVAGKTIVFTTTNGTRALLKAAAAETVLIGAFINRQTLVDQLYEDQRPIHLVCAGTDGDITGEDVLFAGAVVEALMQSVSSKASGAARWERNDCARIAEAFWRQSVGSHADTDCRETLLGRLSAAMRVTHGGGNLRDLGYDDDIKLCSAVDSVNLVPMLNRSTGVLS